MMEADVTMIPQNWVELTDEELHQKDADRITGSSG